MSSRSTTYVVLAERISGLALDLTVYDESADTSSANGNICVLGVSEQSTTFRSSSENYVEVTVIAQVSMPNATQSILDSALDQIAEVFRTFPTQPDLDYLEPIPRTEFIDTEPRRSERLQGEVQHTFRWRRGR